MKRITRTLKIAVALFIVGAIIFGISSMISGSNDDPKEETITYTQLLQKIEDGDISKIEMQNGSVEIQAHSESAPDTVYLTNVPNTQVLTEFVQGKILEGQSIDLKVNNASGGGFSFLGIVYAVFIIYLIVSGISLARSRKRMENTFNDMQSAAAAAANSQTATGINYEYSKQPAVTLDSVAGLDEEKAEIQEVIDFIKNPDKYLALGAKIPKGILLDGSPGTGKTLIARAVAGEAGVPFYYISGSAFVEKYVGVGASRIRALFETARKNAPAIIFIDEIDAVGARRDDGSGSAEHDQTLEQLLTELDGFRDRSDILFMGATNRASSLDPALLRPGRFDRRIYIPLPDINGREAILNIHGKNKPLDETVSFRKIAYNTAGFSGAELENLLNEAALIAARKNCKVISAEHIDEAMMKVTIGVKKSGKILSEKERRLTAVHEAGHAIVGVFLSSQSNVKEVSIVPRGSAGGYTLHERIEDKNYYQKTELKERLTSLLGGRAAEALVLGDISTGASNDLEVATDLALQMIARYGMDEDIGPISLAGFKSSNVQAFGNSTLQKVGNKVPEMLKNAETEATDLLKTHRALFDELVELLLEKEVVSGEELTKMLENYSN